MSRSIQNSPLPHPARHGVLSIDMSPLLQGLVLTIQYCTAAGIWGGFATKPNKEVGVNSILQHFDFLTVLYLCYYTIAVLHYNLLQHFNYNIDYKAYKVMVLPWTAPQALNVNPKRLNPNPNPSFFEVVAPAVSPARCFFRLRRVESQDVEFVGFAVWGSDCCCGVYGYLRVRFNQPGLKVEWPRCQ